MQRSAFIGRDQEIAEIRELLATNRIVTLTGVGGCGKTRLALQVGAEELDNFPDGVFLIALAPVSDPDAVAREVSASVGVPIGATGPGMGAGAGGATDEIVLAFLSSRDCLVVLDNCEHLLDACADITDRILARCPKVKILATSREGLRVEGEQSWVVPSLSLPAEKTDANASESVSLFKARAKAVRPGFELTVDNLGPVIEICRRLDGIPLAIEFAAARTSHLSPRQIADRLDDRFRLLTGGQRRVQRQQTLQAALDWSYELLEESERTLLRRLSVFAGDFAIEDAEGVCAGNDLIAGDITDVLGSLVSKSLVVAEPVADEIRYRLLETVRAYCAERLAHADEAHVLRERHRDWYVAWLESVPWDVTLFDMRHGERVGRNVTNIRAALEWSSGEGRKDLIGRMYARTSTHWAFLVHGDYPERDRWLRLGLEVQSQLDPDTRAACIGAAVLSSTGLFDMERARELSNPELLPTGGSFPGLSAHILSSRSVIDTLVSIATGDPVLADTAVRGIERAAAMVQSEAPEWLAFVLFHRGFVEMMLRRLAEAEASLEESDRLFLASAYPEMGAWLSPALWTTAFALGHHEKAARAFANGQDNVIARIRPADDPDYSPIGFIAPVVVMRASLEGADAGLGFLEWQRARALRSGLPGAAADLLLGYAVVSALAGDAYRAAVLLSATRANTLDRGIPTRHPPNWVLYLHFRDVLREALGPDDARRAREEGGRLSLDEALKLARSERTNADSTADVSP